MTHPSPRTDALVTLLVDLDADDLLAVVQQALATHPDVEDGGRGGVDVYAHGDTAVIFAPNDEGF